MKKTVWIDGKNIDFKSSASVKRIYERHFRRDYLRDFTKLEQILKIESNDTPLEVLKEIEFEVMAQICWALAKNAKSTIPPYSEWIEEFEEFPMVHVLSELRFLLIDTVKKEVNKYGR